MLTRSCAVVLLVVSLAACADESGPGTRPADSPSSSSSDPSPAATEPSATSEEPAEPATSDEAADGTRISVGDSELGPMLFDSTGQAIYLFDVETTAEPRCYDACAAAWPPVLTEGEPVADAGVDDGLMGTTTRTDGTRQVTYDGQPLYFYAHEGKREVKCHDVFLNGGNWYVVQPDGSAAPPG